MNERTPLKYNLFIIILKYITNLILYYKLIGGTVRIKHVCFGWVLTTSMSNFLKTENENLRKKTEMEKTTKTCECLNREVSAKGFQMLLE